MKTILYFYPQITSDVQEILAGMRLVTARGGVHIQGVQTEPSRESVESLSRLWEPLGAAVYCGTDWANIGAEAFGGVLSAVYLFHNPATLPTGVMAVRHDSQGTGRAAARELLSSGRSSFAFVHSAEPHYWSDLRAAAFAESIRLHGYGCRVLAPARGAGALAPWQRRLREFLVSLPKPCALFAANDATAEEVLAAARHEGIAVPDDISVLGVDNDETVCERTVPTLSSIQPNFRNAGVLAAMMLLKKKGADGGGGAPTMRVGTAGDLAIVRRASTAALAERDEGVAEALDLIRREACAGLRAEDVAARLGCTRRVADLRFMRATGRTIADEIRETRLAEVKRMLAERDISIGAVSDFCGFSSPSVLRRLFRAETGQSMRQWRQQGGLPRPKMEC